MSHALATAVLFWSHIARRFREDALSCLLAIGFRELTHSFPGSHAARQNHRTHAKSPSPRAMSSSPRTRVPPPARDSSNTVMTLVCTDDNARPSFHAFVGDEERGTNQDEDSHGNDVGAYTQPASGVVGTSSACYPSHRTPFKFT